MLLFGFMVLQFMDAVSTLIFLRHGIGEANPLIRAALTACGNPVLALAAPKLFAMGLGFYAWRSDRHGLLRRMNWLFALCVGWNFLTLAVHGVTG